MNESKNQNTKDILVSGRVHSIQSFGTVDGPGIRTVIFFQGCPLKCKFCHNIDMSPRDAGKEYSAEELMQEVLKYQSYWGSNGGVTISGGEPTYQSPFLAEFLPELKKHGVHIAIDTCFGTSRGVVNKLSEWVDYWMVSIKHLGHDEHHELTGVFNYHILDNIKYLDQVLSQKKEKSLRIRFLVIPGITDSKEHVEKLAEFCKTLKSLDLIEVLAYGTHGRYKWIESFGEYPLDGVPEATAKDVKKVKDILEKNLLKTL